MKWPHDDTASLVSYYGDPRRKGFTDNLVLVKPPWQMTFDGKPIKGVQIHRKCAASLKAIFDDIWEECDQDENKLPDGAIVFDGSYNFRPVRGSSRLSTHAFGAALDLDAEHNGMGKRGNMSPIVVNAFKREGWFWGGDFNSRKDPMHFQAAHEGRQVASLDEDFVPPMRDGHSDEAEIEESGTNVGIADIASNVGTVAETVGTVTTQAKPLFKSHISVGTAALGASSAATAAAAAPPTLWDQFINIWKNPFWWMVVINLLLTGYVIYHYWADHGHGALRKQQYD